VTSEEYENALDIVRAFRSAHSYPLTKAQMGLRSMLRTADVTGEVSSRLKRMATIIDKITGREQTLDLSRMQDIGGCRVVVASTEDVRRIEQRLRRVRPAVDYHDYIESPRISGYRGVHYVVQYTDRVEVPRRIEIQLRTTEMHRWALLVEQISNATGTNFKQDGDHVIQRFLAAVSRVSDLNEKGEPVPPELLEEVDRRRLEALSDQEGTRD